MKTKQSDLGILLSYAGGRRWLTIASWLLSAAASLLALVPFIYIWMIIREALAAAPDYSSVTATLGHYGWMAVIFAVASLLTYIAALMCSHLAAFRIAANIRRRTLSHVMTLPLGFMDREGSGRIRKFISESASATETYLAHQLPDTAGSYATVVGLLALMFVFDWRMGLLVLATVILAFFVMFVFMTGPMLKKKMGQYQKALDAMSAEAVEYVRGIPVVKTFSQSIFSFRRFKGTIDEYQRWVLAYTKELRAPMVAYTTLINAAFAVLIALTLFQKAPDSVFVGNLLYYIIISPAITVTMGRIMFSSENGMIVREAIGRIGSVLEKEALSHGKGLHADGASVDIEDVSFRYPGADRDAIRNVTLHIRPGEHIALVGPSGGGKTSLASLVARFFDVSEGRIRIGGTDIRDIGKEELMEQVSFVFQDSRLLKTSILENVRLGRPEASRQEVLEALHKAQCDDILEKLSGGVDTVIGSHGTYLSGGEQQRISIARVILKDAPILILDEATAFADPDNEARVLSAFSEMSEGKTVITIAHRLSSVTGADRICVVKEGSIVESGTHRELLDKGGEYARMWKMYNESLKWNV